MERLQLHRDLRREILRGHPWVYAKALKTFAHKGTARLAVLEDKKGKFLALGILDPTSPLIFRVLSTERKTIDKIFFEDKFQRAWQRKQHLLTDENNSFRLLNGEGDETPGLICDVYGEWAVLQTDGKQLHEFWNLPHLAEWLVSKKIVKHVYYKARGSDSMKSQWLTPPGSLSAEFLERGICWRADIERGQKTGFFLDQRINRQVIRQMARGQRVLNLFSYTGGFSVSAGKGGATHVTSVDLSSPAIAMCNEHWQLNGLENSKHTAIAANVFDFLQDQKAKYDIVVVDPPSFAPSEASVESATASYIKIFSESAKVVESGGLLALASCSSHITFEMFYEIVTESLSKARKKAQVLKILGQPEDHPFPLACPELRYLKFFLLGTS